MKKDFEFARKLVALVEKEYKLTFFGKTTRRQSAEHGEARRIVCNIVQRNTRLSVRQIMRLIGLTNHSSIMSINREWKDGKLVHLETEVKYFESLIKENTYGTVN